MCKILKKINYFCNKEERKRYDINVNVLGNITANISVPGSFLSTLCADLRVSRGFFSTLSTHLRTSQGFLGTLCKPQVLSDFFSVPLRLSSRVFDSLGFFFFIKVVYALQVYHKTWSQIYNHSI